MAPQLDSGQMQPPISHTDVPTVIAEVRLELQHLLLAVGKAVHREPLCVVVVRHLG